MMFKTWSKHDCWVIDAQDLIMRLVFQRSIKSFW